MTNRRSNNSSAEGPMRYYLNIIKRVLSGLGGSLAFLSSAFCILYMFLVFFSKEEVREHFSSEVPRFDYCSNIFNPGCAVDAEDKICLSLNGKIIPCVKSQEEIELDKIAKITEEIKKHLVSVPAFYNSPKRIPYQGSATITFVLETQGKGTGRSLAENLKGDIIPTEVLVSSKVQALLTGPADITEITLRGPADLQKKIVSSISPLQWIWDVKGLAVGTADLQLELLAFIGKGDNDSPMQVRTFHQEINVEISPSDRALKFINDFTPVWAFGATIITGIGGLLTWFGLKTKPLKAKSIQID